MRLPDCIRRFLPPYGTGSSGATVLGHSVYGGGLDHVWFGPLLKQVFRAMTRLDTAYYWTAYRTWDKYHIVKTDLEPGYSDVDERMFRACFALLGSFVEVELGTKPWTSDADDESGDDIMPPLQSEAVVNDAGSMDEAGREAIGASVKSIRSGYMHRGYRVHSGGGTDVKAIDLWLWYKQDLPALEAEEAKDHAAFWSKHDNNSDYLSDLKDEKLRALIALRRTLWT